MLLLATIEAIYSCWKENGGHRSADRIEVMFVLVVLAANVCRTFSHIGMRHYEPTHPLARFRWLECAYEIYLTSPCLFGKVIKFIPVADILLYLCQAFKVEGLIDNYKQSQQCNASVSYKKNRILNIMYYLVFQQPLFYSTSSKTVYLGLLKYFHHLGFLTAKLFLILYSLFVIRVLKSLVVHHR